MKVAIGYARYSTAHQNPKSVDDQTREIREFCAKQGFHLADVFFDREMSGQTDRRPGFQRFLAAMSSGAVHVVVAESLDRFSRDQEHSAQLNKRARFHGIEIHTIAEGLANPITIAMKAIMSELFIEAIRHQAHRGNRAKILDGQCAGGRAYGYRPVLDEYGRAIKGERVINPEEAAVVRWIYEQYAAGVAPAKIAAQLNAEAIPSPRGRHWKQNTLNGNRSRGTGILNNELYRGMIVWNRTQWRRHYETGTRRPRVRPESEHERVAAEHLQIIDEELWTRVKARQDRISIRRPSQATTRTQMDTANKTRRTRYLLSGLIKCAKCGGDMTIAGSGIKRYYCANAKEKGEAVCTGMSGIAKDVLERHVLADIKRSLMTEAALTTFATAFDRHVAQVTHDAGADRRAAQAELRKIRTKLGNLVAAISAGANVPSVVNELHAAEARKAELEKMLERMDCPAPSIPRGAAAMFREAIANLEGILGCSDLVVRASDALSDLIDRIVVTEIAKNAHEIEIVANYEFILDTVAPGAAAFLPTESSLKLVAGVGFEPTTFRL